jgi:hypothetical protein
MFPPDTKQPDIPIVTLKTDKIMLFATLVFVGLTAGIYNIISGEQEV